jgi:uncharacterized membrane protein YphA (DoxX/SURF4 family)
MQGTPNSTHSVVRWIQRFGFRFIVIYFLLFTFPFPIGSLAPGWILNEEVLPWNRLWQKLAPWIGQHVLRRPDAYTTRSFSLLDSDSWLQWIQVGCFLALALLGSFMWAWFDVERRKDARIREALRYVLRYVLVAVMIGYGILKVLLLQMPAPGLNELRAHYGEFSPTAVLWCFMGYSPAYQFFTGATEVVGGLLLLFRRTTTLGALVTAAVMANVAMMNLCYDVPVKINSLHFLLMAMVLVAEDRRRLLNLLVLNLPTEPRPSGRFWPEGWKTTLARFAHALVLLWIFGSTPAELTLVWRAQRSAGTPHPLEGVYEVQTFKRGGEEVPPTLTDVTRWRELHIGKDGEITIWNMKEEQILKAQAQGVRHEALAVASGRLSVTPGGKTGHPPSQSIELTYTLAETNKLTLEGEIAGQQLSVTLRRVMPEDFPLIKQKFSWVRKWP